MSGSQKRIPKNSIFIIVKFDSREQVIDMLENEDYKAVIFQNKLEKWSL
ncbi:unnamed protein product [marine sediment metagenome]|uniref:DUF1330 domain-containing protein n=1 Tax=marine sediment metagenome TaxID=412755 RepID=X1IHN4_9ZZZZ